MTDIEKKALALVTQLQEEDDGKKYSYAYQALRGLASS